MREATSLVIITGAGANHNAGPDGRPIPLMDGWSDRVVDSLNERERGLPESLGLRKGLSSVEFEETLGAFFRWQASLDLTERFVTLGGPTANTRTSPVDQWLSLIKSRSANVVDVLRTTLYELFGAGAVDAQRAERMWSRLLGQVWRRQHPEDSLVIATTNYDPVAEIAMLRLGFQVETGRSSSGVETPRLEPNGLIAKASQTCVPVIHLHGAVGWYRRGTRVVIYGADEHYNPTLGDAPALLMPDPDKDPARDSGVEALWGEFRRALATASHVLIVGHSLHDPVLTEHLRTASDRGIRLGVTLHKDLDESTRGSEAQRIEALLPGTVFLSGAMHPDDGLEAADVMTWLKVTS